jgi:glycosyltransferase involved in cell wall biosynthesis
MRLLFAHDNKFKVDEKGNLYSEGSFNDKVFERYLNICDELIIIGRVEHIDSTESDAFNLISSKRIKFMGIENIKSIKGMFKKTSVQSKVNNIVKKCDGVIGRVSTLGFMAVKAAELYKKPYLIEVVGCCFDAYWNYGTLLGKIYAPYSFLKTRRYVKKSNFTIYVTNKFLQKRYPTKGESISCSNVVVNNFDKSIIKSRIEKITNMGNKFIFGTIGTLDVKYKGFDIMIKALSILRKQIDIDVEYRILGSGSQEYIKSIVSKYGLGDIIRFDGTLPSGEPVLNWLDSIDVYIQPSRTEGLPRAVIEAMSRGCPVIGSNAGGIPELLDDGSVFLKSDYKSLATIILKKGLNKDWLKKNAIRNFEEAKKHDRREIELRRNEFLNKFLASVKKSI